MYDRLVRNNPKNAGDEFVCFDNRKENVGVAERYNSFLDSYDYESPAWFVFCHEDWETKEDLTEKLGGLAYDHLYGPIGATTIVTAKTVYHYTRGFCRQSDRDGRRPTRCKGLYPKGRVDTFDCPCLIVHSSTILQHRLRFDPAFTFDLYVEDFCINAYEKYGITSEILPLDCQHWSYGSVSERFRELKAILDSKCSGIYSTTADNAVLGNAGSRKSQFFARFFLNHPEKYILLLKEKLR